MPAKSKTLSEKIENLPRDASEPKTKEQITELVRNHHDTKTSDVESDECEDCDCGVDEEEIDKRKLRALHAREYAILEASRRFGLENPGKTIPDFSSEYVCPDCGYMVCDCAGCINCDGSGPAFPSEKCEKCHPNWSDYATDELGEDLAAKYDRDPFFGSDSECDVSDFE